MVGKVGNDFVEQIFPSVQLEAFRSKYSEEYVES